MRTRLRLWEAQIKVEFFKKIKKVIRNNATEGIFSLFSNKCVSGYTIETALRQNKNKKSPTLKEYLCRGTFIYFQSTWGEINDVETSKDFFLFNGR